MIRVRPAAPADADTFVQLVDALAEYERMPGPTPEAKQRLVRDGFGPQPRFQVFLAEQDGRAVGMAMTYETYSSHLALPTLYLEDLFVLPEARRLGVGGALFGFLAGEAVRRGCGRMEWQVLDWNQLAIDFYEKLGARHMREWYMYRLTAEQLRKIVEP
ncbi:GNAT family N-acetyltransferase [soil metagenome]